MLRAEQAYRAVLGETRLSDLIAGYLADADPRAISASSQFVAANQRPKS